MKTSIKSARQTVVDRYVQLKQEAHAAMRAGDHRKANDLSNEATGIAYAIGVLGGELPKHIPYKSEPASNLTRCESCNGNGYSDCLAPNCTARHKQFVQEGSACAACEGVGRINCEQCDGDGVVKAVEAAPIKDRVRRQHESFFNWGNEMRVKAPHLTVEEAFNEVCNREDIEPTEAFFDTFSEGLLNGDEVTFDQYIVVTL